MSDVTRSCFVGVGSCCCRYAGGLLVLVVVVVGGGGGGLPLLRVLPDRC